MGPAGTEHGEAVVGGVRKRVNRWGKVVGLGVALGLVYVAITFVQVWRGTSIDNHENADAIVVLGAAQYDGEPSPVLRARLDQAHTLYLDSVAPLIVVTGGSQEGDRSTEAFTGFSYLREQGVPEEDLVLEVQGTSTWESLAASARILNRLELTEVVLVSDPSHSVRAIGIAEELGLEATVSPADVPTRARALVRETAAVSLGRVVGYRRLLRLEDAPLPVS